MTSKKQLKKALQKEREYNYISKLLIIKKNRWKRLIKKPNQLIKPTDEQSWLQEQKKLREKYQELKKTWKKEDNNG